MEQVNEITTPKQKDRKPYKPQDRVNLDEAGSKKIEQWLKQIYDHSKGFLDLSKSELVQFLIREHNVELSPKELARIRVDHYNPVKHIQWIMPQIKGAVSSGDVTRVKKLQDELRRVEISVLGDPSQGEADRATDPLRVVKTRKRKPKADLQVPSENNEIAKITS